MSDVWGSRREFCQRHAITKRRTFFGRRGVFQRQRGCRGYIALRREEDEDVAFKVRRQLDPQILCSLRGEVIGPPKTAHGREGCPWLKWAPSHFWRPAPIVHDPDQIDNIPKNQYLTNMEYHQISNLIFGYQIFICAASNRQRHRK